MVHSRKKLESLESLVADFSLLLLRLLLFFLPHELNSRRLCLATYEGGPYRVRVRSAFTQHNRHHSGGWNSIEYYVASPILCSCRLSL